MLNKYGCILRRILIFKSSISGNQLIRRKTNVLSVWDQKALLSYSSSSSVPIVTLAEIKRFLNKQKIRYHQGYTSLVLPCAVCSDVLEGDPKTNSLYVNMMTGYFLCMKCKSCGSWPVFQNWIIDAKETSRNQPKQPVFGHSWLPSTEDVRVVESCLSSTLELSKLDLDTCSDILRPFGMHNLLKETVKKFGIRISADKKNLFFPLTSPYGELMGFQEVTLNDQDQIQIVQVRPHRSINGLAFGWNSFEKHTKDLVFTATPQDALAVCNETKKAALCLPRGVAALPQEILPFLERFKKIILWLGSDGSDLEASRMFARKLNEKRCFCIRSSLGHPSPSEALARTTRDFNKILRSGSLIGHESLTSFYELRPAVLHSLSQSEQIAGVKWRRFPGLNKLLKGLRPGELTVFTGPTGSGKTTFMSEYSLDLCIQGVNTLWGSFEIHNVRLATVLLQQFAQMCLVTHEDKREEWCDKFERLPIHFMTFHGQNSIKLVLEAMSHAVYVHDIQHVVVDNLQFMMGADANGDRFARQDEVVHAFRRFATDRNCHTTVVIHPRKEETDELSTASVYGGARATREADNVLILQDKRLSVPKGRKYIQVAKNRYDGDIGIVPIEFDKETRCFSIKKKPPVAPKARKSESLPEPES